MNCYKWLTLMLCLLLSACDDEAAKERYAPTGTVKETTSYIIGVHPYLNSQRLFMAYEPILRYLEAHMPNAHFKLETSPDYASYEQKLYRGYFHFALPNPYQTIQSMTHGYYVIARMKPDDVFRGILVGRKDQRIRTIHQLKGKSIALPSRTALAASMMPKYFLWTQGINVDKEMNVQYVNSQYSAILNVYTKDAFIAGTWPTAFDAWQKDHPKEAQEMEIIWQTPSLVNNGLVARADIDTEIAKTLAHLLIQLSETEEGRRMLLPTSCTAFAPADNNSFEPVVNFLHDYRLTGLE